MRARQLASTFFIFYCFAVGPLLLVAPWSALWEELLLSVPVLSRWLVWLVHPALRGLVSGFGLLHLVWGLHDLDLLFRTLRDDESGP